MSLRGAFACLGLLLVAACGASPAPAARPAPELALCDAWRSATCTPEDSATIFACTTERGSHLDVVTDGCHLVRVYDWTLIPQDCTWSSGGIADAFEMRPAPDAAQAWLVDTCVDLFRFEILSDGDAILIENQPLVGHREWMCEPVERSAVTPFQRSLTDCQNALIQREEAGTMQRAIEAMHQADPG